MGLLRKLFSFPKKPLTLEQYVKNRRAKGDTNEQIRKDLLDDLDKGGLIFGDFKKSFEPTFPNSKRRFGDQKTNANGEWLYKWSALILPKHSPCPDCLKRNGQSKTWEEWEKLGFPRSGKTLCKKKCMCVVISDCEPLSISE